MGKIRQILEALILLLVSTQVGAAIINLTNTNTEYDSGLYANLQGLEWLTFDNTVGLSRNEVERNVLDSVEGGGWRYAARSETEILLNSLWDDRFSWWSNTNYIGANWFLTTFGTLEFDAQPGNTTDFNFTDFLFGDTLECSWETVVSCHGLVQTMENWAGQGDWTAIDLTDGIEKISYARNSGQGGFFNEIWGGDHGISTDNRIVTNGEHRSARGSLLVRVDVTTVPVPPVLLLLLTGITGLGVARIRGRNK